MIRSRLFAGLCAAGFLTALAASPVSAQEFPKDKPVTLMVGFAAGGGTDTAARIIAKKLSENLGISVVVENKPGAGGNIAHQLMANAKPDGSSILLGSIGPLSIAPHLMKLPYDPEKDLAPITMGVNFPNVLVVNPTLKVKTLAEYIALAKSKPGDLDYASTGVGSASHMAGELFNQRAGVDILHVPYKGGNPALVDVVGGRVGAYYSTPSSAAPHIATGKVIALATTGLERSEALPDVPTIAESGFPGFNATNWYAFVAPGKTPENILERWNQELVKVLKSPDVHDELVKIGLTPMPGTRQELKDYIASESATWAKVIKERNITIE
ncbi:Bug family tripartite tricarboxylate transporter substrate binding protein [Pollutimonas sp. M17]|uniref:Bug family tripartite tricarboxylate transporter substrate binding protein n=1 Tax=Pollutimonas sp. M17 TaxID=2962065 RepID=UPI0021F3D075|nr:tripartite tricarboxylate transporter substrate binding protein [Pollutimonas sp. M17]UYO93243.1 tripartite tricarboxylate transporter substrate binding protein [Pollutimonas sp. M17]HWK72335.1 tripartite tricarboxylate transporter substrate binding protein [Burkholderiaceae bacterium]